MAVLTHDSCAIFNGSIAANIAYGADTSIDEVKEVCKKVGLHEFILDQGDKYNTRVGEDGLPLSSSLKQKIGVARLLLRDTKVVILDEPTQGMDPVTETQILVVLKKFIRGKTAIVMTSSPTVVKGLGISNVHELKNGKLVTVTKEEVKEKIVIKEEVKERVILQDKIVLKDRIVRRSTYHGVLFKQSFQE